MGICSSAKKHLPNGEVNREKKNSLNSIPNGIPKQVTTFARRKSVKLQEFDRVSNATLMDGNFTNLILRFKEFFLHGYKQSTSQWIFWYYQKR